MNDKDALVELLDQVLKPAVDMMMQMEQENEERQRPKRLLPTETGFRNLNEDEKQMAIVILEHPDFKAAVQELLHIASETYSAVSITNKICSNIDFEKMFNTLLSDYIGVNGYEFNITVTKR